MKHAEKHRGGFPAPRDIGPSVRPERPAREKIVLCDPSGSDKPTLIRCTGHLETVHSGRIVTDGTGSSDSPQAIDTVRRGAGTVLQQVSLFPLMAGPENCVLARGRWPTG